MKLIDDKNNAWLYTDAYAKAVRDAAAAEREGYVKVPEWFPTPTQGYKYQIFGQMLAYMKPKPKLRHVIKYKFIPQWWLKIRANRYVRALFEDMKT